MQYKFNKPQSFGIMQYIFAGITLVFALYIAYILFFVALWGVAIGSLVYMFVTIKKQFINNRNDKRGPITIEHNND